MPGVVRAVKASRFAFAAVLRRTAPGEHEQPCGSSRAAAELGRGQRDAAKASTSTQKAPGKPNARPTRNDTQVNPRPFRQNDALWTAAVLLFALAVRSAVAAVRADHLLDDRDAYLAIARNLAAGRGFTCVAGGSPTAFRPPLYPLLLSLAVATGAERLGVAALHVLLGVGTVWLTLHLGRGLGLGRARFLAGLLVAGDPLLLQYSTYPMTETLCTFLLTLLLALACTPADDACRPRRSVCKAFLTGVVFGLATLCRPTVWAFGGLVGAWWLWRAARGRKKLLAAPGPSGAASSGRPDAANRGPAPAGRLREHSSPTERPPACLVATTLLVAAGVAVVVLPWAVRNKLVLGRFVVTTTHGGYTLLLGNNPVFYREVVQRPWGTVWSGESLERWQEKLKREWRSTSSQGEVQQDRWLYRRAWRNISEQPVLFAKACWLRVRRFWALAPQGPARRSLPPLLVRAVWVYYLLVFLGAVVGAARLRKRSRCLEPLLLLLVAFTLVHSLYWSNVRMRAPLVPVLSVLAAAGVAALLRVSGVAPRAGETARQERA